MPTSVVEGIPGPSSIAVFGRRLVWTDPSNAIWGCDLSACQPAVLKQLSVPVAKVVANADLLGAIEATCGSTASLQPEIVLKPDGAPAATLSASCPVDVASSAQHVFFANRGDNAPVSGANWSITACSLAGCFDIAHDKIVSAHGQPDFVAAIDDDLYVGSSAGRLLRWAVTPDAGAVVEVVPNGERFRALAVSDTRVFWIGLQKTVRACTRTACVPNDVSSDTTVQQIVADHRGLYWTSVAAGRGEGLVSYLANDSASPTTLVTGQISPLGIAVDDQYVYFSNASDAAGNPAKGSIMRIRKP